MRWMATVLGIIALLMMLNVTVLQVVRNDHTTTERVIFQYYRSLYDGPYLYELWLQEGAVPRRVSSSGLYTPSAGDGNWVVGLADRGDFQLVRINLSTDRVTPLTPLQVEYQGMTSVSADGGTIIFQRRQNVESSLYTIASDSFDESYPVNARSGASNPAWFPDGRSIVYARQQAEGYEHLYRFDLHTETSERLTDPRLEYRNMLPAVSPDGQWIAFTAEVQRAPNRLMLMRSDGSRETELSGGSLSRPAWTTDSQWIIFSMRDADAYSNLYRIRPDGTDLTRLTGFNTNQVYNPTVMQPLANSLSGVLIAIPTLIFSATVLLYAPYSHRRT